MTKEERDAWLLKYLMPRLSQMWSWYPVKKQVKNAAAVYQIIGNRKKFVGYRCAVCGLVSDKTDTDHIVPKGVAPKTLLDLPAYLDKYYPLESSMLQQLCKACHAPKTKIDVKKMRSK